MATKTLDAAIAARKKVTDGAYVPIMQTDGTLAQVSKADLAKAMGGFPIKQYTPSIGKTELVHIGALPSGNTSYVKFRTKKAPLEHLCLASYWTDVPPTIRVYPASDSLYYRVNNTSTDKKEWSIDFYYKCTNLNTEDGYVMLVESTGNFVVDMAKSDVDESTLTQVK